MKKFLCAFLWTLFALAVADRAHAATTYYWYISGYAGTTKSATPDGACTAFNAMYPPGANTKYVSAVFQSVSVYGCQYVTHYASGDQYTIPRQAMRTGDSCATGATYDAVTGLCKNPRPPDPNCPPNMYTYTWATPVSGGSPQPVCLPDGDANTPNPDPGPSCSYTNPTTGKCEASCWTGWTYKQVPTGAMACVKDDNTPPQTPQDNGCPAGYMNLSSSGDPNCTKVPDTQPGLPTPPPGSEAPKTPTNQPNTNTQTGAPQTTTNPDGGTTTTQQTTTTNRDGSTTTTTTTTTHNADGSTSTSTSSTTGNTPSGTQGKYDSSDKDQNDLCIRHPELNICKNSVVNTATCANVTCTGDAIQCAVLREQMKHDCDLADIRKDDDKTLTDSSSYDLGTKALSGNDPMGADLPTTTNGDTVAMPEISSQGWLGGGSCFPDKVIAFHGTSFTIPFSQACDKMIAFRYAVMLMALLASLRIAGGAMVKS